MNNRRRKNIDKKPKNHKKVTEHLQTNPKYKDFLFRFVFREKADLLALYNAVNDTTYDKEDEMILKLTDSFPEQLREKSCLQVTARMLNINIGHNEKLLNQCKKLGEYAAFIDKVRSLLSEGMESAKAIDTAVKWSIENDVLKEILEKNRLEVADLLLTEYNAEEQRKLDLRDAEAIGETRGDFKATIRTQVNDVDKIMDEFGSTLEKACSVIGITVEAYQNYKKNL